MGPCHVGFGPGFVDEDQPRQVCFGRLLGPLLTLGDDLGALLLFGAQRLFFSGNFSRFSV
jgi:hypothetical protein